MGQKNTLCHSFRIIVILSGLLSFLPNYCQCHLFRICIVIPSELLRELQILTSSKSFPYPKGEKSGHRRWPYLRVYIIITWMFVIPNILYVHFFHIYVSLYLLKYTLTISEKICLQIYPACFMTVFITIKWNVFKNMKEIKSEDY